MAESSAWLGWDGRCLRWRAIGAASIELRIDGTVFERIAAADGIVSRDFPYSPTGNPDLEFSLHDENGSLLSSAWCVTFGRAAAPTERHWQGSAAAMRSIPTPIALSPRGPVAIIVPVFNAALLVERCVESLIRWTSAPARLILIDDASTDPAIVPTLARFAGISNVSLVRNASNLGYTRSCNLGIEMTGNAHVVLLNSDTQVGPRWLDRLFETAFSASSIGTVTAVSDNAGAFSVPELEKFNPMPAGWTLEQTQRALLQNVSCPNPELPTGNGFCMFIKRAMLDDVGILDADAFPFGYGEENDLCQRAERAGYRHVIAGDVLVSHARSASFGDQRRIELGERGMRVLRERYPDYEAKVGATLFGFERRVLDYRVRRIYADTDRVYEKNAPRARLLHLVPHADDVSTLDMSDSFEHFAACGSGVIDVYRFVDRSWQATASLDGPEAVEAWLVQSAIECVCANHDAPMIAKWRQAAEKVSLPFVRRPVSALDTELRWRDGWNSIAAFGSS